MKKFNFLALSLAAVFLLSACSNEVVSLPLVQEEAGDEAVNVLQVDGEGNTSFNQESLSGLLQQTSSTTLGEAELSGIKFMLEEEKLARDVYKKLYEKWGQKNFDNISKSEQTHIAAVRSLAEKYGIDVAFYNDELGKFTDKKLAGLFADLTKAGEASLVEALKVGALIEEIDIVDLEEYSKQTSNQDILLVYENLLRGSRNHLRSFVRTMSRQGQNYEAQRLNQAAYEAIVNSDNEQGGQGKASNAGGNGAGQGQGGKGYAR